MSLVFEAENSATPAHNNNDDFIIDFILIII